MYRNQGGDIPDDSAKRDGIIAALKKELYDLRDKEHQYISLSDDTHNCESKYSLLKEEKERKEYEYQ